MTTDWEVQGRYEGHWECVYTGEDKADATALALQGAGPVQVPGAGAHGTTRTLWRLDRAAGSKLPPDLAQRGRF